MQKVYTEIVMDWSGNVLREDFYWYDGTVALCKGDNIAKQQEQQQLQFNTQLMSVFNKQFASQSKILDFLTKTLQPMITNPTGYSRDALNTMRTETSDTVAQQYQHAKQALQQSEFTSGSEDLPSGVNAQLNASLASEAAATNADAQNNITLKNEDLKQQNYWNAVNGLTGNAATYNPIGYAGTYNQGSGNVAGLSEAVTTSQQSQLMGALGGIASGVGGVFAGAGTKGLFGK